MEIQSPHFFPQCLFPWTSLSPHPPLWSHYVHISFVSPTLLALLMLFSPKIRLPFASYPGQAYINGLIGHLKPLLRSSQLNPLLLACPLLYHVDSRPPSLHRSYQRHYNALVVIIILEQGLAPLSLDYS